MRVRHAACTTDEGRDGGKGAHARMGRLRKLLVGESGQDFVEYGIALAIIALGAAAPAVIVAGDVGSIWQA